MQIHFQCCQQTESPLVAYDQSKSEGKILLDKIKGWRNEQHEVEFSHFLARRDRTFAITRSDHQIYWITRSMCHKLENRMKVYFVASSYGHVMFLTDPIDQNTGNCVAYNPHGYTVHRLPNGHSYTVPKKSSVIGFRLHGSAELFGGETKTFSLDLSDPGMLEFLHMQDVEKCLDINEYVVYMSCAAYTSILLTNHGRLMICGSNGFGELGFDVKDNKTEKLDVHPIHKQEPNLFFTKTACGDHNIVVITKEGLVYVTGYNSSNEL